jgi:hypothetical protein
MNQIDSIAIVSVDTKTIAFRTPPCPIQPTSTHPIVIPLVITQNDEEIGRVEFLYQSCKYLVLGFL